MTRHLRDLTDSIHVWRATHPDWNSTSERVASYALEFDGGGVLLVDPLLGEGAEGEEILEELRDFTNGRPVHTYVTVPFHVRDSERIARELGGRIFAHATLARRLDDPSLAVDASAADAGLPFGIEAIEFGSPRRNELLLHSPAHRALVVGDLAIGTGDGLRIWQDIEGHEAWYDERFLPSLEGVAALDLDHVLVTHGSPFLGEHGEGKLAIRAMLDAAPVSSIRGQLIGDAVAPHHAAH